MSNKSYRAKMLGALRAHSSVGQSGGLIIRWSQVRVLVGPSFVFLPSQRSSFRIAWFVRSLVPAATTRVHPLLSTIKIADGGDDRLKQAVNRKEPACCVPDGRRLIYKGYEEDSGCVTDARRPEKNEVGLACGMLRGIGITFLVRQGCNGAFTLPLTL